MLGEQTRARWRGRQSAEIENAAFHCHICCCIDSSIVHSIDFAFKSRAETIMAALSPFSTRTGDKTTHGSSQSTGRTALVAIEVFVVMGMNRIDKGMNRARTVGGALHGTMEWLAGMAWRHQIEPNRREEGTGRLPPLSFQRWTSCSSPFSHDRPVLHSSHPPARGAGGTGGGRDG